MSDQPGAESIEDHGQSFSVDDEDQLQPSDTLTGDDVDPADPVEQGYTAPDRLHGSTAFGVTPFEQAQDETIDQRVMQERPDPETAYGAPQDESGLDADAPRSHQQGRVGGDDPDSIPAEDDFVGPAGSEVGRLVEPDEGVREDAEKDVVASEQNQVQPDSAEEAAIHYTDEDTEADLERP
ncbi:DUF5709 domain-containing protein [Ornithinicoccus halotolerans]|uniref:DUF5709 domain-containing protein n=1 Tax=Ornithinicoccus halotolerans TaxID=1748220 RepID=UPI001297F2D0|nr:DUF5709 domain-containing protein [Ornithinicoccus halotolerans]